MYNYKTMQEKIKGQWKTIQIVSNNVSEMLINDMTERFLFKRKQTKIEKDCNGIIVYYNSKVRAVYSDCSGKIF